MSVFKRILWLLKFFYNYERYFALGADVVNVGARLYIMHIFIVSGWLKLMNIPATFFLFEEVYKIHWLSYKLMAVVTIFSELILAPLLILGFMTRYLAVYFLLMTLVINDLYVVRENYYWMIIFAMLATYGGGKISIDQILRKKCDAALD